MRRDRTTEYKIGQGFVRGELSLYTATHSRLFNLPLNFETGVHYAVGNMRYYLQYDMGKAAALENLTALADELSVFIDSGAEAIMGLDADTSLDPAQWMLQYQVDWGAYFRKTFHKEISDKELWLARRNLSSVSVVETESSFLLLSTTGHLTEFYKRVLG